jgi:small multidrug resistance pump
MQPWLLLFVAIVSEVGGTTSMKLSDGFSRLGPSVAMVVLYCISFVFLTYALKYIDVGVAYALWAGLGTALVAGVGFVYFGEALTVAKVASLSLIVAGVIGLNLSGGVH